MSYPFKNCEYTQRWLDKTPLVVAGYRDPVREVNLFYLVHLWYDCYLDGHLFSREYPYAADYFQIEVDNSEITEPSPGFKGLLSKFNGFYHLNCWYYGDLTVLPPQI